MYFPLTFTHQSLPLMESSHWIDPDDPHELWEALLGSLDELLTDQQGAASPATKSVATPALLEPAAAVILNGVCGCSSSDLR